MCHCSLRPTHSDPSQCPSLSRRGGGRRPVKIDSTRSLASGKKLRRVASSSLPKGDALIALSTASLFRTSPSATSSPESGPRVTSFLCLLTRDELGVGLELLEGDATFADVGVFGSDDKTVPSNAILARFVLLGLDMSTRHKGWNESVLASSRS